MPTDWKSVYEDTLALLTTSSSDPELQKCRSSVAILFDMSIQKLPAHIETVKSASLENLILTCESLIDLANEEMLAMPYKDVPLSWRRLLTDASLLKAVCHILLIHSPGRTPAEETILRRICNCLDTSIVVAGAPGDDHRVMTDRILNLAQRQLQELNKYRFAESDESSRKRRRIMTDKADSTLNYPVKLREKSPSFMEFCDYINADDAKPFILDNIIDHWPALNDHPWASMRYLLSVAGERLVPVELGSQYTEASWSQRLMPFHEFVESYIEKGKDENADIAYLAQHDLFHQIPRLQEDIVVPDYCYVSPKLTQYYERQPSDIVTNAWFGPGGTISPLHHDPYHNLLAQVVGSKYIRLYSPEQSARLYPHTGMMSNTSQVQIENVDEGLFPEFKNVPYIECILKAGQVLYIPPKWWHYVRSLETSFSVSFWF